MVTGREFDGRHLCYSEGDGFTFGGHENDFFIDFDACFVAEETRNHESCAITYRIDGRVLDYNSFIRRQKTFERSDHSS